MPSLAEGVRRHPDGSLAEVTLTFRAADVPALGYRAYWASRSRAQRGAQRGTLSRRAHGWTAIPGLMIENETFRVTADPAAAGRWPVITDKRTGSLLLRGPGNEMVLAEEYPAHPRWGEGPWHLSPKGPGRARRRARPGSGPSAARWVRGWSPSSRWAAWR